MRKVADKRATLGSVRSNLWCLWVTNFHRTGGTGDLHLGLGARDNNTLALSFIRFALPITTLGVRPCGANVGL